MPINQKSSGMSFLDRVVLDSIRSGGTGNIDDYAPAQTGLEPPSNASLDDIVSMARQIELEQSAGSQPQNYQSELPPSLPQPTERPAQNYTPSHLDNLLLMSDDELQAYRKASEDSWGTIFGKAAENAPRSMMKGAAGIARSVVETGDYENYLQQAVKRESEIERLYNKQNKDIWDDVGDYANIAKEGTGLLIDAATQATMYPFSSAIQSIPGAENAITTIADEASAQLSENAPVAAGGDWSAKNLIGSGGQAAIEQIVPLAMSVLTRNPKWALGNAMVQGTGHEYQNLREQGYSPHEAVVPSLAYGGAEVLGEKIPLPAYMDESIGSLWKRIGKAGFGEAFGESITSALQSAVDMGTVSPDMTMGEFFNNMALDATIGGITGGVMAAPAHGIHSLSKKYSQQSQDGADLPIEGESAPSPSVAPTPATTTSDDAVNSIALDAIREYERQNGGSVQAQQNPLQNPNLPAVDVPDAPEGVAAGDYGDMVVTPRQDEMDLTPEKAADMDAIVQEAIVEEIDRKERVQKISEAAAQTAEPTEAQKEAGNYRKGKIKLHGLDISIETPKGRVRSGIDENGNAWENESPSHYGYVRGTTSSDGEQVDTYVGDNPNSNQVYIVNQIDPQTGKFDEVKVLMGFSTYGEAVENYINGFSDGSGADRIGGEPQQLSVDEFKDWLKTGNTKKPFTPAEKPAEQQVIPAAAEKQKKIPAAQMVENESAEPVFDINKRPTGWKKLERENGVILVNPQTNERVPFISKKIKSGTALARARAQAQSHAIDNPIVPAAVQPQGELITQPIFEKQGKEKILGKARKKPSYKKPVDLITFLARNGGISDEGGDLTAAGVNTKFVPGAGKLVRANGKKADYARELAVEAGYGNFETIDDLNQAIIDSYSSKRPHYKPEDAAEAAQGTQEDDRYSKEMQDAYARAESLGVEVNDREVEDVVYDVQVQEAQNAEALTYEEASAIYDQHEADILAATFAEYPEARTELEAEQLFKEMYPDDTAAGIEQEATTQPQDSGKAGEDGKGSQDTRRESETIEAGSGTAQRGRGAKKGDSQEQVVEKTEAGDQTVIAGAERISDKQLAERKMEGGMKAKKPQKEAGEDGGLFDTGARQQVDMFDVPAKKVEAEQPRKIERKIWPIRKAAEGDAPIVEIKNKLGEYLNSLTDKQYAKLEEDAVVSPKIVATFSDTAERADRLVEEWKKTLSESKFKVPTTQKEWDALQQSGRMKDLTQEQLSAVYESLNANGIINKPVGADSKQAPIKLTKRGDFYEAYGDDARRIAKGLELVVTKRDGVESVGIPAHSLERSVEALKDAGVSVEMPEKVSAPYTVAEHKENLKKISEGKLTADEIKELFQRAKESKDAITAEAQKMTKAEISKQFGIGGRLRGDETKDWMVKQAYTEVLRDFYMGESFSWSPTEEKIDAAYERLVMAQTQDDIDAAIKRRAERDKERKEYTQSVVKSLTNPQTLEEYRAFAREYGIGKMTDEQLANYDLLASEATIAKRAEDKAQSSVVKGVTSAGDVSAEITETKHTKKGHDLFVVNLGERVERDVFNELNATAKRLGGYYSSFRGGGAVAGFQFTTKEAAENFIATTKGEDVTAQRGKTPETKAEKLRNQGQKIIEAGEEKLNQDRKVNTARRANMAASAEANAAAEIAMGKTMQAIADKIEDGTANTLQNINARTEIEMLHSFMRRAMLASDREQTDLSYSEREKLKGRKFTNADARKVEYPYPSFHIDNVEKIAAEIGAKSGYKLLGQHLLKLHKAAKKAKQTSITVTDPKYIAKIKEAAEEFEGSMGWYAEEGVADYLRTQRLGLTNMPLLRQAVREYAALVAEKPKADPVKEAERALVGKKWDGYFPTPDSLAQRMAEELDVDDTHRVLEPSAGKGSLIDAAIAAGAKQENIDALEIVGDLRNVLEMKGHKVIGRDFMEHEGEYDRIIMNPPFENMQDVDHVQKAYELLAPNGKIVAIMSESPFFRSDKKAAAFREWLDSVGGTSEQLPEGSFKDSDRSTGVATRLVVITKDGDEQYSIDVVPSEIGGKQVFLYRGIRDDGSRTDAGNLGDGRYASPSKNVARGYGKVVVPIAMNVQNPISVVRDADYIKNIQGAADKLGVTSPPLWSGSKQMSAEFASEFREKAIRAGHDGAIATMPNGDIVEVASYERYLKQNDPLIQYSVSESATGEVEPFFYAAEKAVGSLKMEKASGKQWLSSIQNSAGVKAEEIEWLGLAEWLESKDGSVTKQEVTDFINGSKLSLSESILKDDAAKYKQYTLAGGENYREILFTLGWNDFGYRHSEYIDFLEQMQKKYDTFVFDDLLSKEETKIIDGFNKQRGLQKKGNFKSQHFDEPNILAHARVNDRTGSNGEQILFVEELQSDWHQSGRKKGYNTPNKAKTFTVQKNDAGNWIVVGSDGMAIFEGISEERAIQSAERANARAAAGDERLQESGVPNAPFKKTWQEFTFKKMLREAVENGYDAIGWTTGEQQAERFDLRKHIKSIGYIKRDGKYSFSALQHNGQEFAKNGVSLSEVEQFLGKEIAQKMEQGVGETVKTYDDGAENKMLRDLDLAVGGEGMKGFYDKILPDFVNKYTKKWGGRTEDYMLTTQDGLSFNQRYSGAVHEPQYIRARIRDLDNAALERQARKVLDAMEDDGLSYNEAMELHGSEGLATEFGGKMDVFGNDVKIHYLKITDAMRESVMRGQPLFAKAKYSTKFEQNKDVIKERIYQIAKQMNPNVQVKVVDELFGEGAALLRSGAATKKRQPVAGAYSPSQHLVRVSLAGGDPIGAAYHEMWHSLEKVLTSQEQAALKREFPETDNVTHEERVAYAYEDWANLREKSEYKPVVKQIFQKVMNFFNRVGNMLRGMGFQTYQDIFEDAYRGDIGQRMNPKPMLPMDSPVASYYHGADPFAFAPDVDSAGGMVEAIAERNAQLITTPEQADAAVQYALDGIKASLRNNTDKALRRSSKIAEYMDAPDLPASNDLGNLANYAVHPRTIAKVHPEFAPVWRAAEKMFEIRDRLSAELGRIVEPYYELEDKKRLNAVLELGRLQGEIYSGDNITAKNTGTKAQLSKDGDVITLNKKESDAYAAVRKAMDAAMTNMKHVMLVEAGFNPSREDSPQSSKDVMALMREQGSIEPEREQLLSALFHNLEAIEEAQRKGYVPFTRFGNMALVVKDKDGNTLHREHFETGGFLGLKTGFDKVAIERAKKAALRNYPDAATAEVVRLDSEKALKQADIDLNSLDTLVHTAGLSGAGYKGFREALETQLQKRGFKKHFFKAYQVPGYSTDFERSLSEYVYSLSSYIANRSMNRPLENAISSIVPTGTDGKAAVKSPKWKLREYAEDYVEYIRSPQEEFQRLRNLSFFYYLAGNLSSALVNHTQVYTLTSPFLMQYTSPQAVTAELAVAYKDAAKMLSFNQNGKPFFDMDKAPADVRADIKKANDRGDLVPQMTFEQMGIAHGRSKVLRKQRKKAAAVLGVASDVYGSTERLNRIITYIATHRIARDSKVKESVMQIHKDDAVWQPEAGYSPDKLAHWVIDETHFKMGKINRPRIFRKAGSALLQFKSFSMMALEQEVMLAKGFLKSGNPANRKAALKALAVHSAMLVMFAGMFGLPFGDDAKELVETIYKGITDTDLDIEKEIRMAIAEMFEDSMGQQSSAMIAEFLTRGTARAMGVDISQRAGMGNILPMDTIKMLLGAEGAQVTNDIGINFDMTIGRVQRMAQKIKQDRPVYDIVSELVPNFIKNPIQAYMWSNEGVQSRGRTAIPPSQVDKIDIFLKAAGFTSSEIASRRETEWMARRAAIAPRELQRNFYTKLVKSIIEKDFERTKSIRKEILEYNKDAPLYKKVILDPNYIRTLIKQERMGYDAKKAPVKSRGEVEKIRGLNRYDQQSSLQPKPVPLAEVKKTMPEIATLYSQAAEPKGKALEIYQKILTS